jgi:hypothetical protein
MSRARASWLLLLLVGVAAAWVVASTRRGLAIVDATAAQVQQDGRLLVRLVAGSAERSGHFPIGADFETLMKGLPTEKLTHRGEVEVDGTRWTIWLADAKSYPLVNRGMSDADLFNDAARLSIDTDGDGRFDDVENWCANLPVRIGDTMFDVKAIAEDGASITLERSKSPLRGIVVGRRVPPFELTTEGGAKFSDASLAGKPYLLDLWSVT